MVQIAWGGCWEQQCLVQQCLWQHHEQQLPQMTADALSELHQQQPAVLAVAQQVQQQAAKARAVEGCSAELQLVGAGRGKASVLRGVAEACTEGQTAAGEHFVVG